MSIATTLRTRLASRLLLALTLLGHGALAADAPRRVIVDDDITGVRSSALLAIQAPDVEVLGLTLVSGSVWRDEGVAHALRMLEIIGRSDIPVVPGAIFPLVNTEQATRRWEALYGKLVYKGAWMDRKWPDGTLQSQPLYHAHDHVPDLPEGNPTSRASNEIAANFLIRTVRRFPGQVTVIATGPLTNLALAQRLDPQFAANAKELVFMGGSLNPQRKLASRSAQQFGREYLNTPRLEFNFRWDPEAASIVLRAPWRRIVMVPADPSTATELTPALLDAMTRTDTPLARSLKRFSETGFPMWDEIATAVWLNPALIATADELAVDVDTSFTAGYGNTLSWPAGEGPGLGERPVIVVREVDVKGMERLMIDLTNRATPRPVPQRP
ncbi:MAG TPA: nucleoside hydrolase [Burkholderiaceae bacterium]|nr:nucleoside hydrolase [Burkholderiaceae bacterium]